MRYSLALIGSAVGAATAFPSFWSKAAEKRAVAREAYDGTTNWAGIVMEGTNITQVKGSFRVPLVGGDPGSGASAWIGIDGKTCTSAILQAGISFYSDGRIDPWYEWYPDPLTSFSDFNVAVGDVVEIVIEASSNSTGSVSLENISTGSSVSHSFNRTTPGLLCQTNAEWIVEDFLENGKKIPFANFKTVQFAGTSATVNGTDYTAAGHNSYSVDIDGSGGDGSLTSTSMSNGQIYITYTGPVKAVGNPAVGRPTGGRGGQGGPGGNGQGGNGQGGNGQWGNGQGGNGQGGNGQRGGNGQGGNGQWGNGQGGNGQGGPGQRGGW